MRNFILTILIFTSSLAYAQDDVYGIPSRDQKKISKTDTIPFKGAERIIVKNQLSKIENFKLVKAILANEELELANSDEDAGQIKTGPININAKWVSGANYFIIIFCKDNEIALRSQFKSGMSAGDFIRIEDGYQPAIYMNIKKGNIMFDKMKDISSGLKGKVYYSTAK